MFVSSHVYSLYVVKNLLWKGDFKYSLKGLIFLIGGLLSLWSPGLSIFQRPLFKFFWMWIFPYSKWDKLGWCNWFNFLCKGYLPSKGFWCSCMVSQLYEERTSFSTGLISRKLCAVLLMFLIRFTSFSFLFLFPLLIAFFAFMYGF